MDIVFNPFDVSLKLAWLADEVQDKDGFQSLIHLLTEIHEGFSRSKLIVTEEMYMLPTVELIKELLNNPEKMQGGFELSWRQDNIQAGIILLEKIKEGYEVLVSKTGDEDDIIALETLKMIISSIKMELAKKVIIV